MNTIRGWYALTVLLLAAAAPAWAQSDVGGPDRGGGGDSTEQEPLRSKLPEPLELVHTNLLDLENSDYFTVVEGAYRTVNNGQDQALVWTVRVEQPITCRHVVMQLDKFRDVRFYKTLTNSLEEVHSTLLYYSPRIDTGAALGQRLRRYDVFEVWIYLNIVETRKINSRLADTAIFAPRPRRRR